MLMKILALLIFTLRPNNRIKCANAMNTKKEPTILAIDTSFDETALAIVCGRRVVAQVIYSQIALYKEWGGVVPTLARRAHEDRFDWVMERLVRRYLRFMGKPAVDGYDVAQLAGMIDAVAVTRGPGLAIALEVGITHARSIADTLSVPIIAVNHMEGHLISAFVQNSSGTPSREMIFPMLGMLVSGAHTEIVLWSDHLTYTVLGETVDDAAGEALDKAARMLGFGYPGGALIERMSMEIGNVDEYVFPRPMIRSGDLQFSFSGLKTALLYTLRDMSEEEKVARTHHLASSFQAAVFGVLLKKLEQAIVKTGVKTVVVGGGVYANKLLRKQTRQLVRTLGGRMYAPASAYLYVDNAAMIGVAGSYYFAEKKFAGEGGLDRVPRLRL